MVGLKAENPEVEMSDIVHWILAAKIKSGAYAEFDALIEEMVAATQSDEPGALIYEYFVSEDKGLCHIYERYENNAAVMTHLGNFGAKFADRFLAVLEPVSLTVYGDASQEVRDALAGFGAVHMIGSHGFSR